MTTLPIADLDRYRRAQAIARETLSAIGAFIRPGSSAWTLTTVCRRLMDERGATGYWWHDVPALILTGSHLRDSVEGDAYRPASAPIDTDDMVTIDLSPEIDGYWGDAARTFFLVDGEIAAAEQAGLDQAEGMAAERALHAHLLKYALPSMTFRDLHAEMDSRVRLLGFENLDFRGNYGHSIGRDLGRRAFMDAHCDSRLDSVPLFTFEPHIARPGSKLAFKYEEIYRFAEGRLQLL